MKLSINKKQIASLCQSNDISYLGLFGSYARGDQKKRSDIDILVEFKEIKSLFELADVQIQLENIFDKKIDLILKNSVKKSYKPYIFKDLVPLYEEKQ
ncbi:hypothetical protein A2954_04470 [Candidatus Roizmanbacteria bacterium RIFCSPLOWO2_01_FULL_37_12]|uniref:Polymerase beta nucleotidyltransferase domain-containing protein n=1 Tax=Candidatus Roizmanbacteria bacterium RIFCSPLOWO2_01_FULL_37_12 TaxID=1802056 RepID=A0A1F7IFV1_9BACT|nr:MAG: hypothetical protein A3D76_06380 [Candidatus Roizmanbacteria bacterium RIFCSPHIGHO2_02_FULL_37_9b]OGK42236.1 MAG: hypothetical protein A2954_04470 [Candidatus Roizmanbacteria bacterium RIFCSPLOWO2_01_FULL_37_12]